MAEVSTPEDGAPDQRRSTLRLTSGLTLSLSTAGPLAAPETGKTQDAGWQLLALAGLIEGWADALPRWDSQVTEPWFVFLERAYKEETSLAERLGRLPTCRLTMCSVREQISLTLAGISVRTDQGLAAALRAWARKARERADS